MARFRPDGTSGMINIVMKKNIKSGWNAGLQGNIGNRDRRNAPTGIAMDLKNDRLFSVCASKGMVVLNALTGKIIATLPIGGGVDAVAFDPETKLIFCSCGDGATVIFKQINADKYEEVQKLTTPERARTLTVDIKTHKLYLSVANYEKGTHNIIPNTFRLLIYKPSSL